MWGYIFELMPLSLVPDDFIEGMQLVGGALAVQCLILTGEKSQTAVTIAFAKIADAFSGDVLVLFWPVDLPLHILLRKEVGIEDRLPDTAQKTDAL